MNDIVADELYFVDVMTTEVRSSINVLTSGKSKICLEMCIDQSCFKPGTPEDV